MRRSLSVMLMTGLAGGVVGLLGGPALAQTVTAPQATPSSAPQEEVEAFREALERYTGRMEEFRGDIQSIVDQQEGEERARIAASYNLRLQELSKSESELRRITIEKLKSFLAKYPNASATPEMLYRLADLYLEEAELAYDAQNQEYARLQTRLATDPTLEIGEPPVKDFSQAISGYRQIIERHPDYPRLVDAYYNLAWCLNSEIASQYDEDAARDIYKIIIERFPGTVHAADANMQLGEYYFDELDLTDPTKNVRLAIQYYNAVVAQGVESRNYDKAIYKLGWSYYKLDEYDQALSYMVRLLDHSDNLVSQTGKESPMRPEAVTYLAISYADIADRRGQDPVQVASRHIDSLGAERPWEHDVMARLADTLLQQARFDQAIIAYQYLQERWPLHPENPVYQNNIALIYFGAPVTIKVSGRETQVSGMPIPDPTQGQQALASLSERYADSTPWYEANRTNPDAVAKARTYIETSLAQVATEYLQRAVQSGQVQDFAIAAQKYREFLDNVPFADNYDEYEWYLAYALFQARQYREAEVEYLQILKNQRSPYRDGARWQLMKTREAVVDTTYGSREQLPAGALVERDVTTPYGKTYKVYRLFDEYQSLVTIYDDLAKREFTDPEYAPLLEQNRAALIFIPAQILYVHNRYDEARVRFEQLIQAYPQTDEALFAASYMVDSYTAEGDLAKVQELARTYTAMDLGASAELKAMRRASFQTAEEQASYNRAYALYKEQKFAEAAQAYQSFLQQFSQSELYDEALFAAADNFNAAGQTGTANRLFEQFVNRYPTDPRSQGLYFRIASNYSQILELNRAIEYYKAYRDNFPTAPDRADAVYNAAFLQIGIGDHASAAQGFESYASIPGTADAEEVFWRAGEQWELVGENQAIEFYRRYIARYPNTNPDHYIAAWYRLAKIYEARNDRRAGDAWAQVETAFSSSTSASLGPAARSMAAEGALRGLQAEFERFKQYKYGNNENKNVTLALETKPAELRALVDHAVAFIQRYQEFETTTAALYIQGMAYFAYSDMIYNFPVPPNLTDEELEIFQGQLDAYRLPAEDRGKTRLVATIEQATSQKQWSEWASKALEELHTRYPTQYPSERAEGRGQVRADIVPVAGPETMGEGQ